MFRAALRGRLKVVAVVFARLLNTPATMDLPWWKNIAFHMISNSKTFAARLIRFFAAALLVVFHPANAATVEAHFESPTTVPVTSAAYSAAGNDVAISIGFAPPTGTSLTIVKNTGLAFISGQFINLVHGQTVNLTHNGITYPFFANYYGGTGNDLVMEWAYRQPCAWGYNSYGQLGNGGTADSNVPISVTISGALAGKSVSMIAAGYHSLALCTDGTVASWGYNGFGQLGIGATGNSKTPVLVTATGVLAGKIVTNVAAGERHSLASCSDGTVAAWGANTNSQLGDGSATNSNVPVAVVSSGVLSGRTVTAIAAGGFHNLVLCSDGNLASWGNNSYGQLGDGGTVDSNVPVSVTASGALAGKTISMMAAGGSHNLVLCTDGSLFAWGCNIYGQLGNGNHNSHSTPTSVIQSGTLGGKVVVAIIAGFDHSVALCADGTLAAWGRNNYGQLGDGSATDSNVPVAVVSSGALSGRTVTAIAAGGCHNLALCSDGNLVSWGANFSGQLGNGGTADCNVPVAVAATGSLAGRMVGMIAAGGYGSIVLAHFPLSPTCTLASIIPSLGNLSPAFSPNTDSYTLSIPNAATEIVVTPTATNINSLVMVNGVEVASGTASNNISLSDGTDTINIHVTAEDGTTAKTYTLAVTRQSADSSLSNLSISAGTLSPVFNPANTAYNASVNSATASLTVTPTASRAGASIIVNGSTVTSGNGKTITLSTGDNTITVRVTAQDAAYATTYTLTVFRPSAVCTLSSLSLSAGTLSPTFTSGTLSYTASVANVESSIHLVPTPAASTATLTVNGVAVPSGGSGVLVPLAVGSNAITILVTAQDGVSTKIYTITVTRQTDLVAVFTGAGTIPVTASSYNATDKRILFSIGYTPTTGASLTVVRNTGLGFFNTRFLNLAQGQIITMAYGGQMFRFVANYYGGSGNDLVLQWADTKAFAWGANSFGQLGDGTGTNASVPVAVVGGVVLQGKVVLSAAVGASHSLVLCADGTVASWGANTYGQLGNGNNDNQAFPSSVVQSGALSGKLVVAVAAGFNHSLALCSDGTVAAWGFNSSGQLGNGSTSNSNVPVAVKTTGTALAGKTVVAVSAGANHSLALCADGTVVAWGGNAYGQLGNGSSANSNVAVNISASGDLAGRIAISFTAGSDHSLALCSDGALLGWGRSNYGQLGNGVNVNSSIPITVDMSDALAGKAVSSVSAGGFHGVATCTDGTLAAFGRNNNGQLGNN